MPFWLLQSQQALVEIPPGTVFIFCIKLNYKNLLKAFFKVYFILFREFFKNKSAVKVDEVIFGKLS